MNIFVYTSLEMNESTSQLTKASAISLLLSDYLIRLANGVWLIFDG